MADVFLFDVYGTLLDVHSAMAQAAHDFGESAALISQTWRAKQLEYTWTLSLRGQYRGFRELTEAALDYALATHGAADGRIRSSLLGAYARLKPFDDVVPALTDLKRDGARLAALSNGDPDMLEAGLVATGIRDRIDAVLSVAALGVYKPARAVYDLGRRWAGTEPDRVSFVSANAWDAAGAKQFGFRTFWLNRADQAIEYGLQEGAITVASLRELSPIRT